MMNIVSMFDESGNMLRPWAIAGYLCHAFDIQNQSRVEQIGKGAIFYHCANLKDCKSLAYICSLKPRIIFGFPPCTDLAVSGSRHFASKRAVNPNVFEDAMQLVRTIPVVGQICNCPWMFENPVSLISSLYRKPDHMFHPYEYGGYLPDDDLHPRWSSYIAARDAYPKRTCVWIGNGFRIPSKLPVSVKPGYSTQFLRLGGNTKKTKQIRSETPRGFAQAVFVANVTVVQSQ